MTLAVFESLDAIDSFLYACSVGDFQTVSDWIRNGSAIDVEDTSGNGNTSLQVGDIWIFRFIFKIDLVFRLDCFGCWSLGRN